MPSPVFEFDASHLLAAIRAANGHLTTSDMSKSIAQSLLNINKERHRNQVDPDGKPWHPLKPATIARKAKAGKTSMLVWHGDLLRFYARSTKTQAVVGTADRKAYWHHYGTSRGLPARPLVGFPASDERLTVSLVDDHLRVALARDGLM